MTSPRSPRPSPGPSWGREAEPLQTPAGIDARVFAMLGRHGAESGYVQTPDGAVINYKRFGHSPDVLAFCNGLGGTYRTFADLFAELLPRYSVLVYDYRGMFESALAGNPPSTGIETHARDLLAVLDHVGVAQAPIFGWSMGVQVALEAVRIEPGRFSAVVLSSGVASRVLDTALHPRLAPLLPAAVDLAGRLDHAWMQAAAGAIRSPLVRRAARRLGLVGDNGEIPIEHVAWALDEHDRRFWGLLAELHAHDASRCLAAVRVPTLVVHGERDKLTPLSRGLDLRRAIPGAQLWVVPDGTHAVVVERPQDIASRMLRFLDAVPPSRPSATRRSRATTATSPAPRRSRVGTARPRRGST